MVRDWLADTLERLRLRRRAETAEAAVDVLGLEKIDLKGQLKALRDVVINLETELSTLRVDRARLSADRADLQTRLGEALRRADAVESD